MDWQMKFSAVLGTGIIANSAGDSIFTPVIQGGALGLLLVFMWMSWKSANADREARAVAQEKELAARAAENALAMERLKITLEAHAAQMRSALDAVERAYSGRNKKED